MRKLGATTATKTVPVSVSDLDLGQLSHTTHDLGLRLPADTSTTPLARRLIKGAFTSAMTQKREADLKVTEVSRKAEEEARRAMEAEREVERLKNELQRTRAQLSEVSVSLRQTEADKVKQERMFAREKKEVERAAMRERGTKLKLAMITNLMGVRA